MNNLWLCVDCGWAIVGDPDDAHQHHHTPDTFSHWIYEFGRSCPPLRPLGGGVLNEPTGRSIHTSDTGGYYFEARTPSDVANTFAMHAANTALARIRGRELAARRGG